MPPTTKIDHPGLPKQHAFAVPGYDIEQAAWWPCPLPEDDNAFRLSVAVYLLGYDQLRKAWLQCLVGSDSIASEFTFVTWANLRGILREVQERNPLSLYGCNILYAFAQKVRSSRGLAMPDFHYPAQRHTFLDEEA